MSDSLVIVLVAGLVATAAGLLGPFLVLRRMALLSDAVSHAVLPGIVAVWLVAQTRAPLPVVIGAAAIALVFPALFSLGVLGVTRFAEGIHLDLDSTIYGELAFVPFDTMSLLGVEVIRPAVVLAVVVAANLALVLLLWKELKATTFDPQFGEVVRLRPRLLSRLLLLAVAVTAVAAFQAVGAILVVTMLIVPAATAYLLTDSLTVMVALAVAVGWVGAIAGHAIALAVDSNIAGAMGLVCSACFVLALVASPRHGVLARRLRRRQAPTRSYGETGS